MIKRRLYKQEHGDNDENSGSSSSSSDSELEPQEEHESENEDSEPETIEEEDDDEKAPEIHNKRITSPDSPGSGYETEDSSEREVEFDSSGDEETGNRAKKYSGDFTGRTLKFNSVYKCRLCPRIVCLTEESLSAHLSSKRHARSEKLLEEGRLKIMLNSDGEIEEDQETHAERHARTVSIAKEASNKKKKNKGRQRQRNRLKKKTEGDDAPPNDVKAKEPKEPSKKPRPDIEKAKNAAKNLKKNVGDVPEKAKEKKEGKKSSKKKQKIEK